jgi:hypothetical protein
MATLRGYLFTLIARRPLALQGRCGGPGAALGWAAGAGAGAAGHVAASELPRARQRGLEPQDTWQPRSCRGLCSGSWSRRTRGSPELPRAGQRELEPQDTWRPCSYPGLAAGGGTAGHVVAPELPWLGSGSQSCRTPGGPGATRAGQRELEPQDTWRPQSYVVHAEVNHTRERVICMSRLLS